MARLPRMASGARLPSEASSLKQSLRRCACASLIFRLGANPHDSGRIPQELTTTPGGHDFPSLEFARGLGRWLCLLKFPAGQHDAAGCGLGV